MTRNRNPEPDTRKPENGCPVTFEQLQALPLYHRETIPTDYLDSMGHMNVRWYMALFDEATWHFFNAIGMTRDYFINSHAGGFALKNFINYWREVRAGQTVALRTRLIGRTDKRFHFMHFMLDETAGQVASSLESLGTHADLKLRRSAPLPGFIANAFDAQLAHDNRLEWQAPVCGAIAL